MHRLRLCSFGVCREVLKELWLPALDAEFRRPDEAAVADDFGELKAVVLSKIQDVLTQYRNTQAAVHAEQQRLLDEMKSVYSRAAAVVRGLPADPAQ